MSLGKALLVPLRIEHTPDLLPGSLSLTGGQHGHRHRRSATAPGVVGRQRSTVPCFTISGALARQAVCAQRVYLCCIAHFAHWLTEERYCVSAIHEAVAGRFLAEHLPQCSCPYPVGRLRHELRVARALLIEVLRADGVAAVEHAVDSFVAREMAIFDAHMRDVWGLADTTRQCLKQARRFFPCADRRSASKPPLCPYLAVVGGSDSARASCSHLIILQAAIDHRRRGGDTSIQGHAVVRAQATSRRRRRMPVSGRRGSGLRHSSVVLSIG